MKMKKHTPGPWHAFPVHSRGANSSIGPISSYQIRDEHHNIIARTSIYGQDAGWAEVVGCVEANAKLVAAAPDLLAALEEVVRISDRKHDAWDRAKVAIAKAKEE
jgi:hypothetical protein